MGRLASGTRNRSVAVCGLNRLWVYTIRPRLVLAAQEFVAARVLMRGRSTRAQFKGAALYFVQKFDRPRSGPTLCVSWLHRADAAVVRPAGLEGGSVTVSSHVARPSTSGRS